MSNCSTSPVAVDVDVVPAPVVVVVAVADFAFVIAGRGFTRGEPVPQLRCRYCGSRFHSSRRTPGRGKTHPVPKLRCTLINEPTNQSKSSSCSNNAASAP